MKPFLSILLAVLLILFSECSSKTLRKQRKKYDKATSGVKYRAYKTTSAFAIASSLEKYNQQQPDSLQIHGHYAHLLLGYFWSVSGKSSFAFAEADIVEEKSNEIGDPHVKYLGQSLRSIAMYQAGWDKLAKEESTKAREHSTDQASTRKYEAAVFYVLMGTVYIHEKDFKMASPFWNGFATETGIHWPYQMSDAAADFQAGNAQQGWQKVKTISQDLTVPKSIRDELTLEIGKYAGGSVNSSFSWPSAIGKIIWQDLKNSSHQSLNKFANIIEAVGAKL